jgi:hypothetical protein
VRNVTTPQYEQRTSASGPLGPGPSGDTGAGAVMGLGQQLAANQHRIEDFREQNALVSANEELQGARSHWVSELNRRRSEAPAGATGFAKSTLADFDADMNERLKRAQTPLAKERLRERLADVRLSIQQEAEGFELSSATRNRLDGLGKSIEDARVAADFRPQDHDKILAETMTAIAGSGLTDEQRLEQMEIAGRAISSAAVAGMIRRDPRAALAELNNEKSTNNAIQGLGLDERQRARSAAQSEINRREAEARAMRAEAQATLRADTADAFAARVIGLPAKLPERSRYLTAYGAEGAERYAQDTRRWTVYDVAGEAAFQTPQEAVQTLEKLKPTGQAGAAEGLENYQAAQALYAKQREALEANPVAVLEARTPELRAAHEAAIENPESIGDYFSLLRAHQYALGIAEPKLLPEAKRAEIANALVFDIKAPARRAQTLALLQQSYGADFVDVMREVAPKLDGMGRVLIGMDLSDAQRLDAAYAQKDALAKAVPSKATTDVDARLREELASFASTLADQPDGMARYAEVLEAGKLYAQMMVSNGTAPEEAARQAADAVINRQYHYSEGLRIPSVLNEDRVTGALERLRGQLATTKGRFLIDVGPGSTPEAAQEDMRALIARSGYWITNESGTGAVLRIPHRSGQGEVYRLDGKRIEFSFSELEEIAMLPGELEGDWLKREIERQEAAVR